MTLKVIFFGLLGLVGYLSLVFFYELWRHHTGRAFYGEPEAPSPVEEVPVEPAPTRLPGASASSPRPVPRGQSAESVLAKDIEAQGWQRASRRTYSDLNPRTSSQNS